MSSLVDWSSAELATFTGPVDPSMFVSLSFATLIGGFAFASLLLIYELNATKTSPRNILYELGLATPSSLLLGFGVVMLFSAIGIHV
ncbi:hypothetical protein BC830DRAFT_1145457 [Chytriomyces sp. MP71]|nr:hypothetical protein BC830DRAFT_1145457 [Chytriomyces sp. MP71]